MPRWPSKLTITQRTFRSPGAADERHDQSTGCCGNGGVRGAAWATRFVGRVSQLPSRALRPADGIRAWPTPHSPRLRGGRHTGHPPRQCWSCPPGYKRGLGGRLGPRCRRRSREDRAQAVRAGQAKSGPGVDRRQPDQTRPCSWVAVSRSRALDVLSEGQIEKTATGSRLVMRMRLRPHGTAYTMWSITIRRHARVGVGD